MGPWLVGVDDLVTSAERSIVAELNVPFDDGEPDSEDKDKENIPVQKKKFKRKKKNPR